MATRFLTRPALWQELRRRVNSASVVRAAAAYVGTDGMQLLDLPKGSRLLVDMSIGAVRQGVTNPREIQKLMKKGVEVFTRASLHAKFFVLDNVLICGSANISHNAAEYLDEAGVMTNSKSAVRRAREYFDRLCSEPVTEPYLNKCLRAYKPPRFKAARLQRRPSRRTANAKAWFVGGLGWIDLPKVDQEAVNKIEEETRSALQDEDIYEVVWIRLHQRDGLYSRVKRGSWLIECLWEGLRRRAVYPPELVLDKRPYTSNRGAKYYLLMTACRKNAQAMSYSEFRRRVRSVAPSLDRKRAMTRPIEEPEVADMLLRMWTRRGRISKRPPGMEW